MAEIPPHPTPPRRAKPRPRWRWPLWPSIAALLIVVGAGVALYPQMASWFNQREQSRILELEAERAHQPPLSNPTYREELLREGAEYNAALGSGALLAANSNVPTSESAADSPFVYEDMLETGSGVMGRLRYQDLGIDLPIYHGTSDETLLKGVGHLEGTSLPIGGQGNRSVLTAHRGLASATMFTHLNDAKIGDRFQVEVLGEVFTYEVRDYKVIDPTDTETLIAEPGRDLVTLVTCTPLGINTQRILVTGERVTPTPIIDVEAVGAVPTIPGFPWWIVIFSGAVVVAVAYIWWAGYPPKPKRRAGVS